ncbi:MAG TPA: ATP-binding protein [Thermoanaerobaculia bacterium]|nr:ATP-binding protein [Thermoanaerobaculia bacterium]
MSAGVEEWHSLCWIRGMRRLGHALLVTLAVAFSAATILLAFLSFTRKIETFTRSGFRYERSGSELVVSSVEPAGAAAVAGLVPGDRIVLADGQMAGALERPETTLARKPFPHRLVVRRGDVDIHEVRLGKPAVDIDKLYLFLAFVGFLYLLIGLFTVGRNRSRAAWVFLALCLSSFAVYVVTPAGTVDLIYRASWIGDAFFRALLPALLLHFFLIFPKPAAPRWLLALLYLPAAAYLAGHVKLLTGAGTPVELLSGLERLTELWYAYFGIYAIAVLARLAVLLSRPADAESEKQVRWMGLGVAVGLIPFLLLSVLPRAFGLVSPVLSTVAVVSLVFIPLAFCYAILKWRLWDVETFVREALGTTAAVVLGGMTFVLLNTLLDRTFGGMAEAGKNVVAFGSGLVLASLLVPVKKRLTGVLEKIQYHETYRSRRALYDIARDFSTPRTRAELSRAIVQRVQDGLHVVPCTLFLLDDPEVLPSERELLSERLASQEIWRLRGASLGQEEPPAVARLHSLGYRAFFALRGANGLAGALGIGHKDGRVPLSSEDEGLLVAVMAQAALAHENARLYGALAERLEEIRGLQQYQESVIRSSSSGILVLDRDDRVHSANPAFAAMVGTAEAELLGLPFSRVLPGVAATSPEGADGEQTVEARWTSPAGEERDLRLSFSAFQGDPDRRVVIVDDVTDRMRAERALAERERLAALGVLAAGVAHEVNTPIAGLSSYAQMLLADTAPGDPRYAILKKMERQTFRAAHLVNNLLEFARPRARSTARTDLRSVMNNAFESVETSFQARRLLLDIGSPAAPVLVDGDARELEQVLVNLLTNARDASPEGATVAVRLATRDGHARVTVGDRGAGISAETQQKIFQPFFTTKTSGGTGLGLAISREIARRHGGDVGLGPRDGGGTEAWLELPIAAGGAP